MTVSLSVFELRVLEQIVELSGENKQISYSAELAGDHEAAARVELQLPDTGVCGGAGLFDSTGTAIGGSCCALPEKPLIQIGRAPATV
jgi:hypothetical protein